MVLCVSCRNQEYARELYIKGEIQYANKNLAEAENIFNGVLKLDDGFLNAYLMLAKIYYYNKDYDKALKNLDTVLDKDPDHTGALYWKGRVLVISGKDDKDEPVKILTKVLENDSRHVPARLMLALVYEKNRKFKEALHEYITVMEMEDDLIMARGNLAVLYRRLGLKERAAQEINRAVKVAEVTGRNIKSLNLIKSELEKWEEK